MKRFILLVIMFSAAWASLQADEIDDELAAARDAQDGGGSGTESSVGPRRAFAISLGSGLFDDSSDLFARAAIRLGPVSRLIVDVGCLMSQGFWAAHGGIGLLMGSPSSGLQPRVYGGPLLKAYLPDRAADQGLHACFGLYGLGGAEFPINATCGIYLEFGGGTVLTTYEGPDFGNGSFLRGGMYLAF